MTIEPDQVKEIINLLTTIKVGMAIITSCIVFIVISILIRGFLDE